MRVIRSLFLLLAVAIVAAGCARQQVAYIAYPTASAPAGIDNVVYGTPTPSAPAMVPGGVYATAPNAAAPYTTVPYSAAASSAPAMVPGGVYAMAPNGAAAYAAAPYGPTTYTTPRYATGTGASGTALYGYAPAATEGPYTLDSGDRLRIVVFGQEGLTNSYLVSASGSIDMPLIGSVAARGLTTDQLAARISEKLREGFVREPHVAVEVESYRPFFILGEVTQPGQYPYVANMTAETAVAIAGGFTPRARRNSVILTRNFYGRQVRMEVPLTFPLRPGDTVSVQERWF
jgi:protein involved in polysaccharide export with SLBB domain